MSSAQPARRIWPLAALLLLSLPFTALPLPGSALAAKGDSRALLYLGTTTQAVGDHRIFGTTFGGNYGFEFEKDLLVTVGGAFSSADSQELVDDGMGGTQVVTLSGSTAAFRAGVLAYFNRRPDSLFVMFAGIGLSVLNYDLDFTGTTIGRTSGTVPGLFGSVGTEVRLTRAMTLILSFGLQAHPIKKENGDSTSMVSGGLVFSLRLSA